MFLLKIQMHFQFQKVDLITLLSLFLTEITSDVLMLLSCIYIYICIYMAS